MYDHARLRDLERVRVSGLDACSRELVEKLAESISP
jgi:hypothetical protein